MIKSTAAFGSPIGNTKDSSGLYENLHISQINRQVLRASAESLRFFLSASQTPGLKPNPGAVLSLK